MRDVEHDPNGDRVPVHIPDDWPEEIATARLIHWTVVTWVVGLVGVPPKADISADFLAIKAVLLPRAPVAGDQLMLAGSNSVVNFVRWHDDDCVARLADGPATDGVLERLRRRAGRWWPPVMPTTTSAPCWVRPGLGGLERVRPFVRRFAPSIYSPKSGLTPSDPSATLPPNTRSSNKERRWSFPERQREISSSSTRTSTSTATRRPCARSARRSV